MEYTDQSLVRFSARITGAFLTCKGQGSADVHGIGSETRKWWAKGETSSEFLLPLEVIWFVRKNATAKACSASIPCRGDAARAEGQLCSEAGLGFGHHMPAPLHPSYSSATSLLLLQGTCALGSAFLTSGCGWPYCSAKSIEHSNSISVGPIGFTYLLLEATCCVSIVCSSVCLFVCFPGCF